MKLTWFGSTTLRVHIGGKILVVDSDRAPTGVDRAELRAGADRALNLAGGELHQIEAKSWRPPVVRPLGEAQDLQVLSLGPSTLLVWAPGEPPLLVANVAELPHLGRWAGDAVFVLFGERGAQLAEMLQALEPGRPKVLALAANEATLDELFEKLAALDDAANGLRIVALEPGLALEV
ncbi:MAG: hypothetical protein ABIO40_12485 [Devosia sp.]